MAEEPAIEPAAEPEVIVSIEPETPPFAKDPAVADLAEQFKELEARSKKETEERKAAEIRAADAERAASSARRDAQLAREAALSSNRDTIETALQSAQTAFDAAKRDMIAAKQASDIEAEVEASARMNQAQLDMRTYDEAKVNIDSKIKAPPQRPSDQLNPSEIVDRYVANRTEATANWLRNHRDYILDGRKNAKLTAAHHDAIAENIKPDTQEYFDHVEKFIGLKKESAPVTEGDDVARPGAAKPEPAKKPATPRVVAPVNGSAGSGGAVSGNTVSLSQREATAATDGTHIWNYDDPSGNKRFKKGDPIGLEEFARRKKSMMASGQYDRTYETQ